MGGGGTWSHISELQLHTKEVVAVNSAHFWTKWHPGAACGWRVGLCALWVEPAVQGSAEGARLLWGDFAYLAHLIICTMCDEEPPILLSNSTHAFLKWRSGEPAPPPPLPFPSLPSPLHFWLLLPCFSTFLSSLLWLAPLSFFSCFFSLCSLCVAPAVWLFLPAHPVPLSPPLCSQLSLSLSLSLAY